MEGGEILGIMNFVKVIEDCSEEKKNIIIVKVKVIVFYFLYLF